MSSAAISLPKYALITGAAKRLGAAIALELARAGYNIALHYLHSKTEAENTAEQIRALGRNAVLLQADLADEAAVQALVPRAIDAGSTLSVVVNNASIFEYDHAAQFSWAVLDKHMHTNLAAPVTLASQLYQHTPETQRAVVINLLDQKLWNLNPDFLSYTFSKLALEGATRLLAQSFAPRLRVVGVAPGLTLTSPLLNEEQFQRLHQMAPLGQSSTPQDIASAVRFAVENPAITGTTLLVDGGQHLTRFERDFSVM